MTEEEKTEVVNALREFVLRVSSDTGNKRPEEINILPAMAQLFFDKTYTFTFGRANQSKNLRI